MASMNRTDESALDTENLQGDPQSEAEDQGEAEDVVEKRRYNPARDGLDRTGLYHSFRLPDGRILEGTMALAFQEERLASFNLPDDLTGKIALDIGPWDGYYSFELERRGAAVTSIDYVDLDTYRELRRAFASKTRYLKMDIYELDPSVVGMFDVVLCFGVLYHLKHPLLALEKVCTVTRDVCLIDTFVVDGVDWQRGVRPPLPYLEFYETDELAGQTDNWCGPTVGAVEALVRAAGFAKATVARVTDSSVRVIADRNWRGLPPDEKAPIELTALHCHHHQGRCFRSAKEEYLTFWCAWNEPSTPGLDEVFPEVDGYGVAPLACSATEYGLTVSARVPPGLTSGAHEARLKIGSHGWSRSETFYVDLPVQEAVLQIQSLQDGVSWETGSLHWKNGG